MDYKWVVAHAKDQYARAMANFKTIDEKAAAIIGYLGGGVGALMVATVASLATDKADARAALLTLPSFFAAIAALVFAVLARRPYAIAFGGPTVEWATLAAGMLPTDGPGEAAALGSWCVAINLVSWFADRKARWLNTSTWALVVALGLLAVPVIGLIILKW